MPESFDKQLSNKIRSTFENYSEVFNNDAWELMKQKLANKKKKRLIWFIDLAKAASIILFTGVGVLWPHKTNHHFSDNNELILMNDTASENEIIVSENNYPLLTDENKDTHTQDQFQHNKTLQNNLKKDVYIADKENDNLIIKDLIDSVQNKEKQEKKIYADLITNADNDSTGNETFADTVKDNRPILRPEDKDFFKEKKSNKKINFGIALSSHYSSSDIGAKDNINIGGGFLTEYIITDKISINSGLLLANHHLNTQNNSLFGGFLKVDAAESTFAGSSETEILLVGLDIPLNVKFNFDRIFISTGVSSLVYLKESYSESYYVENTQEVYNPETDSYETLYLYDNVYDTDERGAFQTFDFAKLINFSVGYKIPLKKGKLILEPYAKIPIGKLTAYSISYGYGGFALKYDF